MNEASNGRETEHPAADVPGEVARTGVVPWPEFCRTFARVAVLSFGGPTGQIAVMHRILVQEKKWISEQRFLHALNFCMLLPGPEAQQLATYIGWLLHGPAGGMASGGLFVLPGFMAILALSFLYVSFQSAPLLSAVFLGLSAAVLVIVIEALLRIGRRVIRNPVLAAIAGASFVAIFFFRVPFPLVIAAAAIVGMIGGRVTPGYFSTPAGHGKTSGARGGANSSEASTRQQKTGDSTGGEIIFPADAAAERIRPSLGRACLTAGVWLAIWFAPVALCLLLLPAEHVLLAEGLFFSRAAVVTFGGAYAVLSYIAQQAVDQYHWVDAVQMQHGLSMAETTPGPLIIVLQFVGFMGAYHQPGDLSPTLAAVLGSAITVWTTFAPCFLWVFVGGPYVETLRRMRLLAAGLTAITAAVVGAILNLAAAFALHGLFAQVEGGHNRFGDLRDVDFFRPNLTAMAIVLLAAGCTFVMRWGMGVTLAVAAIAGVLMSQFLW